MRTSAQSTKVSAIVMVGFTDKVDLCKDLNIKKVSPAEVKREHFNSGECQSKIII